MTEKHLTNQRFTDFELDSRLLQGIAELGFEYCTPIQAESLPFLLKAQDVAGQAKTGTGKTGAFLVAMYQYLCDHPPRAERTKHEPRALILAPTRELAIQIHKDAEILSQRMGIKTCLVYGGTGYESQRQQLQQGVDLLIGTPGRVIDYFKQQIFSLASLQVVVLDEADRMFDLGFIKDIRFLFRRMPPPNQRLNMLFSATLSLRVSELAYEHMNQPQMVKIESERLTVDEVSQTVYFPSNEDKLPLLLGILAKIEEPRTVVFINTKHSSEKVCAQLQANQFKAGVLSGDVPQKKRESLLNRFKAGDVKVLVATDVAARGLHIPDVSHVINYDLPQDPEDYVHRIGRTARAGASGDAISFACETYAFALPDIEAYIGHKIDTAIYPPALLAELNPVDEAQQKYTRKQSRDTQKEAKRNKDRTKTDSMRSKRQSEVRKTDQIGETKSQTARKDQSHEDSPAPKPRSRWRQEIEIPAVG